jgi:hypothetical protein
MAPQKSKRKYTKASRKKATLKKVATKKLVSLKYHHNPLSGTHVGNFITPVYSVDVLDGNVVRTEIEYGDPLYLQSPIRWEEDSVAADVIIAGSAVMAVHGSCEQILVAFFRRRDKIK